MLEIHSYDSKFQAFLGSQSVKINYHNESEYPFPWALWVNLLLADDQESKEAARKKIEQQMAAEQGKEEGKKKLEDKKEEGNIILKWRILSFKLKFEMSF